MKLFVLIAFYFNLILYSVSKNTLNIHVVPHSHNDVGWLKTPVEYYFGLNNYIYNAEVRLILNSMLDSLLRNSNRTFTYDVMTYFSWWYNDLNDEYKGIVKKLLKNGQLEFVNGGMVSNDEACSDYLNIIDQMTDGLLFIKKTFDSAHRPDIAWQMDPFGHSISHATLHAAMEFKALFIGRVAHTFKSNAEAAKALEFDWITEKITSYKSQPSIFTIISPNNYSPPPGFCFDFFCTDAPVIDYKGYENYKEKVEQLIKYSQTVSTKYRTNNVLLTMGNDFNYQIAERWYNSLDLLIKYGNQREGVKFFYSTPRKYYQALVESREHFPIYKNDFFPYTSSEHSVWTGYFSSRPLFKYYVRKSSEFLRACKQLAAFNSDTSLVHYSEYLRQALNVAQHHDAITGTSKQKVNDYYVSELYKGIEDCKTLFTKFAAANLKIDDPIVFCDNMNASSCEFTMQKSDFTLILYNQNSMTVNYPISIPVSGMAYSVFDFKKQQIPSTIIPTMKIPLLEEIYPPNPYMLHFTPSLTPLSFSIYNVAKKKVTLLSTTNKGLIFTQIKTDTSASIHSFENQYYRIGFDAKKGKFTSMIIKLNSKEYPVSFSQNFFYYKSSNGFSQGSQPSGAYIFRPESSEVYPCHTSFKESSCEIFSDSETKFTEIQCNIGICKQIIRLWNDSRLIQVSYAVGPLNSDYGTEVILRWNTDIQSEDVFYTDSNGRSLISRQRLDNGSEVTARNYFPVAKYISIKDPKLKFTVFTDRSLGGSSQSPGSLELMLHRRMFFDDHFGVEEALNEMYPNTRKGIISCGDLWLAFSDANTEDDIITSLGYSIQRPPIIGFSDKSSWKNFVNWSWGNYSLPKEIRLLSFERYPVNESSYLLRFENPFSTSPTENKERVFDIIKFLAPLKTKCIVENVLSADIRIERKGKHNVNCCGCIESQLMVSLGPLEIRTFIISI